MADARFKKGKIPWNKGTKGIMKSNITSFKKGLIPWNRKEHIIKFCSTCNKQFDVKPSLERISYCSRSCAKKGKPSHWKGKSPSIETRKKISLAHYGFRGEKHWNWRHGRSKYVKERKYSPEHKEWRRQIFIRDDYTCQDCGDRCVEIQSHHIKQWVDYPKLRFDLNNGKTLCLKCHKLAHKRRK